MTALAAAGRRLLPRGYLDFLGQLTIWFGFYFTYLGVRSVADRNPSAAFLNGFRVIGWEQSLLHHLFERTAQQLAESSQVLLTAAAWTYWNSEFTCIGLTLLWVYLRRYPHFGRFRNAVLLANLIGLAGYALMPTAPPWMFPSEGFVAGVNHASGLIQSLANPYAAMPSLHAADALIVGVFMVATCRHWWTRTLWALWPAWVWFCVLATANHFVLDVVAGIGVALFSLLAVAVAPRIRRLIADLL